MLARTCCASPRLSIVKEMAALALLGQGEEEEVGFDLDMGGRVAVVGVVGAMVGIWRAGTREELRFWMRDILGYVGKYILLSLAMVWVVFVPGAAPAVR